MPIDLTTQTVAFLSDLITTDDSTANQGGVVSATQILNVTRGELLPKLQAKLTGTLYNAPDLIFQFQKFFIGHSDTTLTLLNGSVYIANGVKTPTFAGFITLTSTDTRDNTSYKAVFQCDIAGSLVTNHTVVLNGTTGSTGTGVVVRIFRGELTNLSGVHYDPYGQIEVKINGQICGYFQPGVGWITSECKIALPDTTSAATENSTGANRLAGPGGLTYTEAFLPADAVQVRNGNLTNGQSLDPADYQPVWIYEELQPGTVQSLDTILLLALQGET